MKRTEQSEINLQSKFILNNIDEIKKCFNYKNIQPLWKIENLKKYNKIIDNPYICERSELSEAK